MFKGKSFEKMMIRMKRKSLAKNKSQLSSEDNENNENSENKENNVEIEIKVLEKPEKPKFDELKKSLLQMNIEELYVKVLHSMLHIVGKDALSLLENDITTIFEFIKNTFEVNEEEHKKMLQEARKKEAPKFIIHINVIGVDNLTSKDANELHDSLVKIYLDSEASKQVMGSVKNQEFLNLKYEQNFSLPIIASNLNFETLTIELWFRFLKTLRKDKFTGGIKVELKTISTAEQIYSYQLKKPGKTKCRGTMKVKLSLSFDIDQGYRDESRNRHCQLLKILLYDEIETSKVAHFCTFSQHAKIVILQHQVQSGLTELDEAFAQYLAYTEVHQHHPLSFKLFDYILDILVESILNGKMTQEEINNFWDTTRHWMPLFFEKVRQLMCGEMMIDDLRPALKILSTIDELKKLEKIELLSDDYFQYLEKRDEINLCDAFEQTLTKFATERFVELLSQYTNETQNHENKEQEKLEQCIQIISPIVRETEEFIKQNNQILQKDLNFKYAEIIIKTYDEKIEVLVYSIINNACNREIKHFDLENPLSEKSDRDADVTMLTSLYQLYRLLSDFVQLGRTSCLQIIDSLKLKDCHLWFQNKVVPLVETAVFIALTQIQNAINKDDLKPYDGFVKFSSSAVDTLMILNQIIIFWKTFSWPDAEQSVIVIKKLLEDINKCCEIYAEKIFNRLEDVLDLECSKDEKSKIQKEWCIAINNVKHICQEINSMTTKGLGLTGTIQEYVNLRGPSGAQKCSDTIEIEDFKNANKELLLKYIGKVARKMNPVMKHLLTKGAEDLIKNFMDFLDNSFEMFFNELSENEFNQIFDAIWNEICEIFSDLIEKSLKKHRLPVFYANLKLTLELMLEASTDHNEQNGKRINDILNLLKLYGSKTSQLIYQHHLECHTIQQNMTDHPFGLLTVQCCFYENLLKIDIMNAKHLQPGNIDVKCDPFVKIHLHSEDPDDEFTSIAKLKTNVVQKTVFPIFDNSFSITISNKQQAMKNALIEFSVKDKGKFGRNKYIGDAYLKFKDIGKSSPQNEKVVQQMQLKLTRFLTIRSSASIEALQNRNSDKQAQKFLKKLDDKSKDFQATTNIAKNNF